jgi:hypothetical protein
MLRVTRDSLFDDIIRDVDTNGVDPTPEYLEKAKVGFYDVTLDGEQTRRYAMRGCSQEPEVVISEPLMVQNKLLTPNPSS